MCTERSDREWTNYGLSRTRIYEGPEDDNYGEPRLTAAEVGEILQEGQRRLGPDFWLLYDVVSSEFNRGLRCPVCCQADNPDCAIEC